ncbi:MAG: nodulation protein NfeD [Acidobacteria bacterium]|nr:nodulation protein NfeD [Acidobacteriota bacterium]
MLKTKVFPTTLLLAAVLFVAVSPAMTQDDEAPPPPTVYRIVVDNIIHRGTTEFVTDALDQAEGADAAAFVIELSTPGGMLDQTREISTLMLNADMPVIVYVSPSGAQAASAGFFLLMSADIAAMAPGTNTGAAHPVSGSGEDIEGTMGEKVEQDAAAQIRSLAKRNGRNVELAESAVLESKSFTAEEALEADLIDLIADDLTELLEAIDGRTVREGDDEIVLATAGARIETVEMNAFQRFISTIAHPNIAAILMTLGFLGLYFEFQSPGTILPGVVGAICLILAFMALSVLPFNYAGILLLLLAGIFFIAEIKVTSYGLLSVAGVISLVLGYVLLFKSADPAVRVSWSVIGSLVLTATVVLGTLVILAIRTFRSPVRTGSEGLLVETGVARTAIAPVGKVFIHGEIWNARAEQEIAAGTTVRVVEVDGMTIRVEPSV